MIRREDAPSGDGGDVMLLDQRANIGLSRLGGAREPVLVDFGTTRTHIGEGARLGGGPPPLPKLWSSEEIPNKIGKSETNS